MDLAVSVQHTIPRTRFHNQTAGRKKNTSISYLHVWSVVKCHSLISICMAIMRHIQGYFPLKPGRSFGLIKTCTTKRTQFIAISGKLKVGNRAKYWTKRFNRSIDKYDIQPSFIIMAITNIFTWFTQKVQWQTVKLNLGEEITEGRTNLEDFSEMWTSRRRRQVRWPLNWTLPCTVTLIKLTGVPCKISF